MSGRLKNARKQQRHMRYLMLAFLSVVNVAATNAQGTTNDTTIAPTSIAITLPPIMDPATSLPSSILTILPSPLPTNAPPPPPPSTYSPRVTLGSSTTTISPPVSIPSPTSIANPWQTTAEAQSSTNPTPASASLSNPFMEESPFETMTNAMEVPLITPIPADPFSTNNNLHHDSNASTSLSTSILVPVITIGTVCLLMAAIYVIRRRRRCRQLDEDHADIMQTPQESHPSPNYLSQPPQPPSSSFHTKRMMSHDYSHINVLLDAPVLGGVPTDHHHLHGHIQNRMIDDDDPSSCSFLVDDIRDDDDNDDEQERSFNEPWQYHDSYSSSADIMMIHHDDTQDAAHVHAHSCRDQYSPRGSSDIQIWMTAPRDSALSSEYSLRDSRCSSKYTIDVDESRSTYDLDDRSSLSRDSSRDMSRGDIEPSVLSISSCHL